MYVLVRTAVGRVYTSNDFFSFAHTWSFSFFYTWAGAGQMGLVSKKYW